MDPVALIGAASGWGAGFRETEAGPPALRDLGLAEWLREAGIPAAWTAMIEPALRWRGAPEQSRQAIFELVAQENAALADAVATALGEGCRPVVLGGDHSIAMGTWGGAARAMAGAPLGLIWFDAHLDAHTVATTPSMNPHGMSAAVLLGHGESEFLAIGGHALEPEHLCYIGARSWEEGEMALLQRLGVRIITMEEVRRRGLAAAVDEAVARVTTGTAGFGLTIDLDGFDPADAPGIGLKEPNGLHREEMLDVLRPLQRHPALKAIEIGEYIPDWDEGLVTAHLVRDLLLTLLAPAMVDEVNVGAGLASARATA
jgi:arginase